MSWVECVVAQSCRLKACVIGLILPALIGSYTATNRATGLHPCCPSNSGSRPPVHLLPINDSFHCTRRAWSLPPEVCCRLCVSLSASGCKCLWLVAELPSKHCEILHCPIGVVHYWNCWSIPACYERDRREISGLFWFQGVCMGLNIKCSLSRVSLCDSCCRGPASHFYHLKRMY